MSEWIEIVVSATVASADDVAALLAGEVEAARQGAEIRGSEVIVWAPVEGLEEALAATRSAVARMTAAGLPVTAAGISARPAAPESEWRDAWKRYFHVTRLTRQLTIVPSWETHAPGADERVIHLDPGLAFGTGAHASTRLLLEELQRLADEGAAVRRFIDVGTGSGILALAAITLWPDSQGVAVDVDPQAVDAARDNAEQNGVGARVRWSTEPVDHIHETFDLVLANIQADVLLALAGALAARVAPGGALLLSGLLAAQVEGVAAACASQDGLRVDRIRASEHDPAWASATLRRAPAA